MKWIKEHKEYHTYKEISRNEFVIVYDDSFNKKIGYEKSNLIATIRELGLPVVYRYALRLARITLKSSILQTEIIETNDEWFYVRSIPMGDYNDTGKDTTLFYKCDQLDGLIHCLKDLYQI